MQYILEKAKSVLEEFGGRNVFETAENSGVEVWFRALGGLKGFYIFENNCRYIVINNDLDEVTQSVVCAHELGHDTLHRGLSGGGIRESTLFLANDKTEREANLFASEILISDDDFLSALSYCESVEALSAQLGYPHELVGYKVEAMNMKGHKLRLGDVRNDFLK